MALFDKIRSIIALFDSVEWAFLVMGALNFNLIIIAFLYTSLKSTKVTRENWSGKGISIRRFGSIGTLHGKIEKMI